MSKKAVIRQNLFSGIFFITKKLAYEKKNKKNKHHFLSENCSTFFTRKFRAIKKILILVISIEAHLPTVRRRHCPVTELRRGRGRRNMVAVKQGGGDGRRLCGG